MALAYGFREAPTPGCFSPEADRVMAPSADEYVRCDELDGLPPAHRANCHRETNELSRALPHGARVLQMGSSDGTRIVRLLAVRPDLQITGLELDSDLAHGARTAIRAANLVASVVTGDIVAPPPLPQFDAVVCLNNTLGYITDDIAAIEQMKRLGDVVMVSVYGEAFDDDLAREYFAGLGVAVDHVVGDRVILADSAAVRRYPREEVESWCGTITTTPLGYLCSLTGFAVATR